mgnify:CR=1 FL=1
MKRIFLLILAVVLFAAQAATAEQPKVTFATGAGAMAGTLNIADSKGFFTENHVTGKVNTYKNGKATFDAYLAGKDDFAVCSIIPIVLTDFDQAKHRIVGVLAYTDNQTKVLARKSAGVTKPSDLRGKTIATVRATTAHYYICKFLELNGVSCDDTTIVYLSKKELPHAIASGRVDAICQHGMPVEKAQKALGDDWVMFQDDTIMRKCVPMVTSTTMVTEHPAALKGVLRATLKADGFVKTNTAESIQILAKAKHYPFPAMSTTVRNEMDYDLSLRQSLLLMLEDVEKWAIENKLVARTTPRNYLDIIASAPLKEVAPAQVTLFQ